MRVFRMLEYQQQISSLEGECRDLKACLQVGEGSSLMMMMVVVMMSLAVVIVSLESSSR